MQNFFHGEILGWAYGEGPKFAATGTFPIFWLTQNLTNLYFAQWSSILKICSTLVKFYKNTCTWLMCQNSPWTLCIEFHCWWRHLTNALTNKRRKECWKLISMQCQFTRQNQIVLYVQRYFARSLNNRYTNTSKEVSGLYAYIQVIINQLYYN